MEAQEVVPGNRFSASREAFDRILEELDSEKAYVLNHRELEDLVDVRGLELKRLLYQDHLTLRGPGHAEGEVTGADGVERTHVREKGINLTTVVGTVRVPRAGYSLPGVPALHPGAAQLNLPADSFSHGMQKLIAVEASKNSFEEAVGTVKRVSGVTLGKRQAEELTDQAAQDFHAFYEARNAALETSKSMALETSSLLILSMDGKGIVMRKEDLREPTRKKAEVRVHKLDKRLSRGEKRNAKRMATVGAIYTVAPFHRTATDVLSELRDVQDLEKKLKRPKPEYKRVWATLQQEPKDVVRDMFQEAVRRDPTMQKRWVALVDGNETQIRLLQEHAQTLGVQLTIILDIIHVTEYLWKAVTTFNKESTPEAEEWVSERMLGILQGNVSNVAAGIRRSATLRNIPTSQRKAVDKCADYLLKYSAYLKYDEYLLAGLPIATGVIEGACRHLIKDRMDITGARWSLKGAEAVLRIRSLRSSGDWEEYWLFHERQELKRNHIDRYAEGTLPPVITNPTSLSGRPALRILR